MYHRLTCVSAKFRQFLVIYLKIFKSFMTIPREKKVQTTVYLVCFEMVTYLHLQFQFRLQLCILVFVFRILFCFRFCQNLVICTEFSEINVVNKSEFLSLLLSLSKFFYYNIGICICTQHGRLETDCSDCSQTGERT